MKDVARIELYKFKAQQWASRLRKTRGHLYRSIRVYTRVLSAAGAYRAVYVVVTEVK